ncbi:hypothetical protein [Palleronia rufa]|uniref:hypothetical protein n=1 Tax=Palleronia rufa TaxID=1530186 RepID=UPI0005626D6D|nr:hypothetical protein [Palleronia rufa]
MIRILSNALAAGLLAWSAPAAAEDFSDPTWPCVQRKVERLSIGLMWPEPVPDTALEGDLADAVETLGATLALRRVGEDEMRSAIDRFVSAHGASVDLMGRVFAESFRRLAQRRTRIIGGIADMSLGQADLAARIDAARSEFDTISARDDPDFDRLDTLEEKIDWDERIYTDRQKSITYVCETPVLLEKRLYAIAQMLQAAASG